MTLHTLYRVARTLGHGVLDLVYPPRCLHCDARTSTPGDPLCSRCLQQPERADAAAVMQHIQRLPAPTEALDGATALWRFDKGGVLQRAQHALKYGNRPRYGVALGRLMTACLDDMDAPDAIVPIPLHPTRFYERGYNQSAMLADGLGTASGLPVHTDWLARPIATRSQTRLARADRWANVAEAFTVTAPGAVQGASLVIVDDIITTGSTAVAAAAALKDAGAAHVTLCALAFARG
jgi:ComF family protein